MCRLSEILVLTFTERAAVELRRRIRSKIEEILVHPGRNRESVTASDRGMSG